MERGRGSRIYDVDGNEYIDWMMAFGALPLGHAHPDVVQAVTEAASSGAHFASATPIEAEVAEMIQKIVPNAERVRFANTGTEAMMAAIRLARGVTGRPKILKFEGHYHGWYDDVLVSSNVLPPAALGLRSDPIKIPDSSGLNPTALDDTIVVPWNDLPELERAIDNHPGQIAAIITEGIMDTLPRTRASPEPTGHHRGVKPGRPPEFCATLKLLAASVVPRRNVPPFSRVSKQWPRSFVLMSDAPSRASFPSPATLHRSRVTDPPHSWLGWLRP